MGSKRLKVGRNNIYVALKQYRWISLQQVFLILLIHVVCKKSGYLFKRNDKNKKWKSMFFVLQMDGTDVHLLMFESPKVKLIVNHN